jgi:hypothetical protein
MSKNTMKIPADKKELYELLADCVDVLDAPAYAPGFDEFHLKRLAQAINNGEAPDDQELLLCVFFALRSLMFVQTEKLRVAIGARRANRLTLDLQAILESRGISPFLYHGTIAGNLQSIHKKGLVPGCKPVWAEPAELRKFADEVVCLCDTWRGAVLYADAARQASRSKRPGDRKPVIVRVPLAGLQLERDDFPIMPGNWMVRGVVGTAEAEVFEGPLKGYPTWRPLAEVVRAARK